MKHTFHDVRGIVCRCIEVNKNADSVRTQAAQFCHLCDTGRDASLLCASPLPIKRGNTAANLQVVMRIEWEGTSVHQTQSKHLLRLTVIITRIFVPTSESIILVILSSHEV